MVAITIKSFINWLIVHGTKITAIIVAVLVLAKIGNVFIKRLVSTVLQKSFDLRKIGNKEIDKKRQATLSRVFCNFFQVLLWTVAVLTILPEFNINIGPLLTGVGVVGLAIGMGARNLIQDYLAGIFIIFEDQYRVGEVIEVLGKKGKVLDINLRRTVLENQGEICYIPNGQIKVVSNLSRQSDGQ